MHWLNEKGNQICPCKLNQCNASFKLGVEEFKYNSEGKLQQIGYRFKIDSCFGKEFLQYYDYIKFYLAYRRHGFPFAGGWQEQPQKLFQIIHVLDTEYEYIRKKNG